MLYGFFHHVLTDLAVWLTTIACCIRFWARDALRSPQGLKARDWLKAWVQANPGRAAYVVLGSLWSFLLVRFMDAIPILTAGHRALSLTFVLFGLFLVVTGNRYFDWLGMLLQRARRPRGALSPPIFKSRTRVIEGRVIGEKDDSK